ncbi:MAG: hypothetical protein QXX95_04100 [Nitrososphaerales archaeon]
MERDYQSTLEKIQELKSLKSSLIEEINKLREHKENLFKEYYELNSKIKEKRENLKEMIEILREGREKINQAIEESKSLKERRNENRAKINEIKKVCKSQLESIEKEISELEWNLQTKKLTREEEKKIILKLKKLAKDRKNLLKLKDIEQENQKIKDKLSELWNSIANEKSKKEEVKKRLNNLKNELFSFVKLRDEKFEELRKISINIKALGSKLRGISEELLALTQWKKNFDRNVKEKEIEESKRKEKEILSKLAQEAKEKLKRGEKLSFEELKVIYEQEEKV